MCIRDSNNSACEKMEENFKKLQEEYKALEFSISSIYGMKAKALEEIKSENMKDLIAYLSIGFVVLIAGNVAIVVFLYKGKRDPEVHRKVSEASAAPPPALDLTQTSSEHKEYPEPMQRTVSIRREIRHSNTMVMGSLETSEDELANSGTTTREVSNGPENMSGSTDGLSEEVKLMKNVSRRFSKTGGCKTPTNVQRHVVTISQQLPFPKICAIQVGFVIGYQDVVRNFYT
eukprot:TRINITY_DN115_c0_g2_i1.p1 TRINITY_DN115_c0_g2~~TRINITY_DN115_c0_g2_i1.p1  ORF type:complete len:231 (-),score=14.93 TRINITY_DN115_c0_g2_i1:227-919(-)